MAQVRCWDYLDGALAEVDFHGLVAQVVQLIREFRPDVVISFGPDGGYGHPDHITISAAATAACWQAGDPASYPGPAGRAGWLRTSRTGFTTATSRPMTCCS